MIGCLATVNHPIRSIIVFKIEKSMPKNAKIYLYYHNCWNINGTVPNAKNIYENTYKISFSHFSKIFISINYSLKSSLPYSSWDIFYTNRQFCQEDKTYIFILSKKFLRHLKFKSCWECHIMTLVCLWHYWIFITYTYISSEFE